MTVTIVIKIHGISRKIKRLVKDFRGDHLIIIAPDDIIDKVKNEISQENITILALSETWLDSHGDIPEWYSDSKKKSKIQDGFLQYLTYLQGVLPHCGNTESCFYITVHKLKSIRNIKWPLKKDRLYIDHDIMGGNVDIIRACNRNTDLISLHREFIRTGNLSSEVERCLGVKIAKWEDPCGCETSSSSSSCETSSSSSSCETNSSSSSCETNSSSSSCETNSSSSSCETNSSSSSCETSSSSEGPHPPPPPPPVPTETTNWYGWVTLGILLAVLVITLLYYWYLSRS